MKREFPLCVSKLLFNRKEAQRRKVALLSPHIELHLPWLIAIGLLLQKTFAKLICAQPKGSPRPPPLPLCCSTKQLA